jgi:hypothetical protein
MKEIIASFRGAGWMRMVALGAALVITAAGQVAAQTPAAHPAATSSLHSKKARPSETSSLAADQFTSEQAAKSHCPGDAVVWVNLAGSKAYHTSGNRYYGKTKHGAFMCQKEADQSGFHAAGRRVTSKSKAAKTKTAK